MKVPSKLKYPRLPFELNRARKLSDEQIQQIKMMRETFGWTARFLAFHFGVSKTCILYHINPETKRKMNEYSNRRNEEKRKANPEWWREKVRKESEYIRDVHKAAREFYRKKRKDWGEKNREYLKAWEREHYRKTKAQHRKSARASYLRHREKRIRAAVEYKRRKRAEKHHGN